MIKSSQLKIKRKVLIKAAFSGRRDWSSGCRGLREKIQTTASIPSQDGL